MMPAATRKAFESLGVSPDADAATIRKAWRALVRAYHPDQVRGDKIEANRRLAELNAAFDLVSAWEPADVQPAPTRDTAARAAATQAKHRRAAQETANRARAAHLDARDAAAHARAKARKAARAPSRDAPRATPWQNTASRAAHRSFKDALHVFQAVKAAGRHYA